MEILEIRALATYIWKETDNQVRELDCILRKNEKRIKADLTDTVKCLIISNPC